MTVRTRAHLAGFFYLVTFVAGIGQMAAGPQAAHTLGLVATAAYVAVIALFYELFKPVSRELSRTAAFFGLVGCAIGVQAYGSALVFFGFYCVLIGTLIVRSTFLPWVLGAGMALAGACWLTNLWPPFAASLSPYIFVPGALGEGALMLWLLVRGVDTERWRARLAMASAA